MLFKVFELLNIHFLFIERLYKRSITATFTSQKQTKDKHIF